jgi:hypothetical protein
MEEDEMSSDSLNSQLARKLLAACIAQQLGNKSIDYTMKNYVKDEGQIGEAWIELAKHAWDLMRKES